MGAGTQTHLIFPRRAIPGVSWSPPLERAEVPQPTAEASRDFASKLAQRKAALEGSPLSPPSPDAATRSQCNPNTSAQTSAHTSPRSEVSVSSVVEESAPTDSAAPASIDSLIQKFERANQAEPHVRNSPSPKLTEPDREQVQKLTKEADDRTPSKSKWWQRLRRNSGKVASSQTRQEPETPEKTGNNATAADREAGQVAASPAHKRANRSSGKATPAAPILTWYRSCVSAPETPPAPFLSEEDGPPVSARIAAHRAPPAAADPGLPAAADQLQSSGVAVQDPLVQSSAAPREPAEAGRRTSDSHRDPGASPAVFAETDLVHRTYNGGENEDKAPKGSQSSRDASQASADAHDAGCWGPSAAGAANLDIWLLPREPSVQSAAPGRRDAARRTPNISPRTPEIPRESAAARAAPAQHCSRLSRQKGVSPGSTPGRSSLRGENTRAAGMGSLDGRGEGSGGGAAGGAPSEEAAEQLEAVRQLASQAARVQRRVRRLVNGRARPKVVDESAMSQPADGSRKRASNTSPPPKRARRKDAQRLRTPSPEKVIQLLSEVDAVSEDLQRRSGRLGAHAAFLDDLQSGIEAVRTRLRTPAASSSSDADTPTHAAAAASAADQQPTANPSAATAAASAADQKLSANASAATSAEASLVMQVEENDTSTRPEEGQLALALPAVSMTEQRDVSGPDRVAEAAARAEAAVFARAAVVAAAAAEGTPSAAALQRSVLDLAALSTTALTASMCLLISVEQGAEVSARACEAICSTVLARVPFGSALLGTADGDSPRAQPSLAVRTMRGGIRIAYGAAGTVSGIGAGVLRAGTPCSLTWRQ